MWATKKKLILGVVLASQTHLQGWVARFKGFKPFARRYVDFREKEPSFEKAQISLSFCSGHKANGIPCMSFIMIAGKLKESPSGLFRNIFIDILFSPLARGPSICFLKGPERSQKSSIDITFSFTNNYSPHRQFVKFFVKIFV